MKRKTYLGILTVILTAFVLVFMTLASASVFQARAESLDIPTPISSPSQRGTSFYPVNFMRSSVITATTRSNPQQLAAYNILDLQYILAFKSGSANTVTLTIQYSNDGVNWVSGAAVASAKVTNTVDLNQFSNFGRYTAIYAALSNSNPVTVTAIGVAK